MPLDRFRHHSGWFVCRWARLTLCAEVAFWPGMVPSLPKTANAVSRARWPLTCANTGLCGGPPVSAVLRDSVRDCVTLVSTGWH